jgi:hypothetical protein
MDVAVSERHKALGVPDGLDTHLCHINDWPCPPGAGSHLYDSDPRMGDMIGPAVETPEVTLMWP